MIKRRNANKLLAAIISVSLILGTGITALAVEEHEHTADRAHATWKGDESGHWKQTGCTTEGCDVVFYSKNEYDWHTEKVTPLEHEYDDLSDTICNICGYERRHKPSSHVTTWYYSSDFSGHKGYQTCANCGETIYTSNETSWYLNESDVTAAAHVYSGEDATVCSKCYAPKESHTHHVSSTPETLLYNAEGHWYAASCSSCNAYVTSANGTEWIACAASGLPPAYADHTPDEDGKCTACNYSESTYTCPLNANKNSGHYEYDAEGHWFIAPCNCGQHNIYLVLTSETPEWSTEMQKQIHYNLSPVAGSTCDVCGYTRPAQPENQQEEQKSDQSSEPKEAASTDSSKEAASASVDSDSIILTPEMEKALELSATTNTTVVIDMTTASEIPVSVVELIEETDATVNLTLSADLILGISENTLEGTIAAPIVVRTETAESIGPMLATTQNIPDNKKLIVMNPVKGATINNTAVIYQFYGPEMAGQVVSFFAADASGSFGVLATSVVFPNGYAAFVVPVVGFVGYAQ